LFEIIEGLRTGNALAIEYKCWRARDTYLLGDIGLILNKLGILARVKACVESGCVQSHGRSKSFQIVLAEGSTILAILVGK
jgi:hypothetical protein